MKTSKLPFVLFAVTALFVSNFTAQAQKPKSISKLPFTITAPGSYAPKANLTGVSGSAGITIAADNVTLDLSGFALSGVPGSLDGIAVSGTRNNIAVRNGTINNWGGSGIAGSSTLNSQFEKLRVNGNGNEGIETGLGCTVKECVVRSNGNNGINASDGNVIINCTAENNVNNGIIANAGSTVTGCAALSNGGGIQVGTAGVIKNCTARANSGDGLSVSQGSIIGCTAQANSTRGIVASDGSTISDCSVRVNKQDGILAGRGCRVTNNTCDLNGYNGDGAGIHIFNSDSRIEGNNVTNNDRGIDVDDVGNVIIKNSARGNTTNYDIVGGNDVGPIGTAATATSPWANIAN